MRIDTVVLIFALNEKGCLPSNVHRSNRATPGMARQASDIPNCTIEAIRCSGLPGSAPEASAGNPKRITTIAHDENVTHPLRDMHVTVIMRSRSFAQGDLRDATDSAAMS
jgi:hypothetical protein